MSAPLHTAAPLHSAEFRRRRFLNWFPLGVAYALLYMGRYNLTVAKNALGELMTKEDFGIIFAVGTVTYAIAFLVNGPLVDRAGGRRGMLASVAGSSVANLAMALYLRQAMQSGTVDSTQLRWVFCGLYGLNMYFQSFGAVAIVKVNASWFHVEERGGFSGIFGTMISSGLFFAFTINPWILGLLKDRGPMQWVMFAAPAALLGAIFVFEYLVLRDKPSQAGFADFDTRDASSGEDDAPVPTGVLLKRIFTNPIIMTVALVELCTGVVRQGVMQWFPIYAKEVWVLPDTHLLQYGSWDRLWLVGATFVVAVVSFVIARRATGRRRGVLYVLGALAFLAPFVQGGWGGILFIAGVIGSNVAGWVSQLFFQNRRAPAAGGLYWLLTACTLGMVVTLATPGAEVAWSDPKGAPPEKSLLAGDQLRAIAGHEVSGWADVRLAVACWEPRECVGSGWDAEDCLCNSKATAAPRGDGTIPARVLRGGAELELVLIDPKAKMRAGDTRALAARPRLPMSPFVLGVIVFLISLCVIGVHGLLSGTATMDFGGRKGAGTAVGVIDGAVYLGTAIQSIGLGYLTTRSWSYWPMFLVPWGLAGSLLLLRIWKAKPRAASAH